MIRIALILLLFASPALEAREYTRILPDQSRIEFSYTQMGVSVDGGFSQFDVDMVFDPQNPEQARVRIEIPRKDLVPHGGLPQRGVRVLRSGGAE